MYLTDFHMHTTFSPDSVGKPIEMAEAAVKRGLSEIAFTDHLDLDYPPVSYETFEEFDYSEYCAEIDGLNKRYEGKLKIARGVEVGLQTGSYNRINNWLKGKSFDFIIGSTHVVDFTDLYDGDFFDNRPESEAFSEYFEDVYNSAKTFDLYDVYGHLDAIVRNAPGKSLDYDAFSGIISEILSLLIKKGKGIEVNASGLRYGLDSPHPRFEIIKRYRELGGEIITIGSDAHRPAHVAHNLDLAYEFLREAGFKAVAVYHERKPVFLDI